MFDNVLVGIDDVADGRDAVALARDLVAPQGKLTLVEVQVIKNRPAPDSGAFTAAAKRRHALARLAALRDDGNVAADVLCVEGRSVREGLRDAARSAGADLLVIRASHLDSLDRVFGEDHTRDVLEHAPCPVAVAPHGYADRAGALRTIGVAFDGSPESEAALAVAKDLAARDDATLSGFTAVTEPIYAHDPWNLDGEIDERIARAREQIAQLGGVEPHAAYGDVVEQLARFERSVDLLVVGSHRYRPIDQLLDGSTSQQLGDSPARPLLVLRPESRR